MGPHVCPWWFAYTFDNPLRRLLHPAARLLAPWVRPGMTVLDVGCGIGHFSLGMARMVGAEGRVVAVDLQEKALRVLRRRAARAGLGARIATVRAGPDRLGVEGPVDFALAFWMAHETPSQEVFFREVRGLLRPGGRLLVAEPAMHVKPAEFEQTVVTARGAGFLEADRPRVRLSHAVVLMRPREGAPAEADARE